MPQEPGTPGTPGSLALENLKKHEKELVEFKVPTTTARKKHKPKILTEEKYIEELGKIIQRDFFPDLERLRAQNEFLDAMDRNDYVTMNEIRAKYTGSTPTPAGQNAEMTPATFETPDIRHDTSEAQSAGASGRQKQVSDTPKSTVSNSSFASSIEGKGKSLAKKHSLNSFLHAYTSEDNHAFEEIMEEADKKLKQKFAVLYNQEKLSAEKMVRALALPAIEKQFEEPDPMRKVETWAYTNMNSIMYTPEGVELTEAERVEAAARKMTIQHSATRLTVNPFDDQKPQKSATEAATINSQVLSNKQGVDDNVVGPKIRGFDLVKTPSPRPGEAFSPLMTWGEIEGTPFRLDGSDTPVRPNTGPSFKINENSRRENIALALADKVGKKMRAQKQHAMDVARKNIGSPFIRSNAERLASMSPAARRLASTKLGLRSSLTTPSPLRTPLEKVRPTANKNPSSKPSHIRTPTASKPVVTGASEQETANLTDDLLKIPTKRLKAADFF